MFKKTMVISILATLLFGAATLAPASAAPGKDLRMIPIIVNGQIVRFPDTEPYINTDGRTMVPVRFVSEKLGAKVEWEAATQTAIIKFGGKTIRMPIGSRTVEVDGVAQVLDTAAEFTDGRTMVPLRFVSEMLDSTVEWDEDAHTVKIMDAQYKAKVDAGEVQLSPWGREISKTPDEGWIRMKDLESTNFYDFYGWRPNKPFMEIIYDTKIKEVGDAWANKIRNYYTVQLNVDYRTIDEAAFKKVFFESASGMSSAQEYVYEQIIERYVDWVKKNKVIAKGYVDPDPYSSFRYATAGPLIWVPTYFKFMIISADDTAQTFIDNYDVTKAADSFKLKKGVWYTGYSVVSLTSIVANDKYSESYGIRHMENMFYKYSYFYTDGEQSYVTPFPNE
jgi:hypothetical protein